MSRWLIATGLWMLAGGLAVAQTQGSSGGKDSASASGQDTSSPYGLPPPFKAAAKTPDKTEMPPEEDKTDAPKVFSFNPVQSQIEVNAGNFYFDKGNYIAAISRYDEATKWNDGNAEAWMRLGEAQQKRSNVKAARDAYQKYLKISPDGKEAKEVKKRLAKLKG